MLKTTDLRHKVTYQQPTKTNNLDGSKTVTWTTVCELYVSIKPLSAKEVYYAHNPEYETTHILRCAYNSSITAEGRFAYGSRVFRITSVIDVGELHSELEILAVERNGG